jgi:N-glycosylase/DNA lyase
LGEVDYRIQMKPTSEKELRAIYKTVQKKIMLRLKEFDRIWVEGTDEDIFTELVFCLLTPQSKAKACWEAVQRLGENDLIFHGNSDQVTKALLGIRFHNTKAKRIIEARIQFFEDGNDSLKLALESFGSSFDAREWLVEHINGFGYKEAGHFLRNIGRGCDLAILDRHILKNLVLYGVIEAIPPSLPRKKYLELERKMVEFSEEVKVPLPHLDLLLWFKETGEIFK